MGRSILAMVLFTRAIRKTFQFQRHVEKQDVCRSLKSMWRKNGISHCSFKTAVTKEKQIRRNGNRTMGNHRPVHHIRGGVEKLL